MHLFRVTLTSKCHTKNGMILLQSLWPIFTIIFIDVPSIRNKIYLSVGCVGGGGGAKGAIPYRLRGKICARITVAHKYNLFQSSDPPPLQKKKMYYLFFLTFIPPLPSTSPSPPPPLPSPSLPPPPPPQDKQFSFFLLRIICYLY